MANRLDSKHDGFVNDFHDLVHQKRDNDDDVQNTVQAIIADIRQSGDNALLALAHKYDGCKLDNLRLDASTIDNAANACDRETTGALQRAADRIRSYHEQLMPEDLMYTDDQGIQLGALWRAIDRVGIYVPGGLAAYPSSVLMSAIPARVANVQDIIMCVPTPKGHLPPEVFACAKIANITEIYCVGGAQAIAAMAYGTETMKRVDKIVGPGNSYVAAAKRQVYGQVGIDMIAGPSEILIVCDNAQNPKTIAMDLLSQAEHDENAQSILICDDTNFAGLVANAVDEHLQKLPRADIAKISWHKYGAIIVVDDLMQDAPALINALAPEHLMLAFDSSRAMLPYIRNAGAIFLGPHTPEAVGDYLAGPSHVLPTARSARFSSGLGVHDFLKRSSVIGCSKAGLDELGPDVIHLATAEGLHAHAQSVALRLK